MIIGGSDERGDWARKFLSDEDFNEMIERGDKFIAYDAEEITFEFPPLTVNECMNIIDKWDYAIENNDEEALGFFHSAINSFVNYLIIALEDIGIIVMDDDDGEDDYFEFEDPPDEL